LYLKKHHKIFFLISQKRKDAINEKGENQTYQSFVLDLLASQPELGNQKSIRDIVAAVLHTII
jgi:hypothetical protein